MSDNGTDRALQSRLGDRIVRGRKGYPEDADSHAPLLARWKGTGRGRLACDDRTEFRDFFATLADLANESSPDGDHFVGRSFRPQLLGARGTHQTGSSCITITIPHLPRCRSPGSNSPERSASSCTVTAGSTTCRRTGKNSVPSLRRARLKRRRRSLSDSRECSTRCRPESRSRVR